MPPKRQQLSRNINMAVPMSSREDLLYAASIQRANQVKLTSGMQTNDSPSWFTKIPVVDIKAVRRAKYGHVNKKSQVVQSKPVNRVEYGKYPPGHISYFNEKTSTGIHDLRSTKGDISKCECPSCAAFHSKMSDELDRRKHVSSVRKGKR